jgi:hypothetical protein
MRAEHRHYPAFHRFSVVLTLQISGGDHAGELIERYYNIPADRKVRRGSDYYREWLTGNQGNKPTRRERMHKKKFVGKLFRIRVVTVSRNHNGIELGAAAYSKASRLLELLVTNDKVE